MYERTPKDLSKERYGRLTVIERDTIPKGRPCGIYWKCKCDCGVVAIVNGNSLRSENTRSCGCLSIENSRTIHLTHGQTSGGGITKIYRVWSSMKERCSNPHNKSWKNYGGRGIYVCKRWEDFSLFFKDMGIPLDGLQLERIDNSKGYSRKNCKWTTSKEQANNRRSCLMIKFNGEYMTLTQWCRKLGLSYHTTYKRIQHGWTIKNAFTKTVYKREKANPS